MASARALNSIRSYIDQEIDNWQSRGARISVRESAAGGVLTFHLESRGRACQNTNQHLSRVIKGSLANGLSDIIIDEYEVFFVEKLIDGNYGYLSSKDRVALKKKILRKLNSGVNGFSSSNIACERSRRKSKVWAKLAEYLEKEDQIILEGFITFRLKDYLEEIFDFVDNAVEEYMIDGEYREFLKLLKHFMGRQKNPVSVVNICRTSDNKYDIFDEQMKPIQGDVRLFLDKTPDTFGLEADDVIVSAVVTLAPDQVIWHGSVEDSPCFDLINDLFEQGVTTCPGMVQTPDPFTPETH